MNQDFAYQYFQEAFCAWIDLMETQGKAPQKEITDLLKVNKSTVNRYVNETRSIPFDKQVMIANASGKHYLDFLIFGKGIFEKKHGKPSSQESATPKPQTEAEPDGGKEMESQQLLDLIARHDADREKWDAERKEWNAERKALNLKIDKLTDQLFELKDKNHQLELTLGELTRALKKAQEQGQGPQQKTREEMKAAQNL